MDAINELLSFICSPLLLLGSRLLLFEGVLLFNLLCLESFGLSFLNCLGSELLLVALMFSFDSVDNLTVFIM